MTTTERIENILRASHAARNDDFELWLIYCQKSGVNLSDSQIKVLRRMPRFETIRRTRQKLQQGGHYPADPAVDKARFEKFKQVRQNINYDSPEKLLEKQGYRVKEWGEY